MQYLCIAKLMRASADCIKTLLLLKYSCSVCPICCQSYRHLKPFKVCHASSHVDFGGVRLPNAHVCMLTLFTRAPQPFQEHMYACLHCSSRLHSDSRSAYCLLRLASTFGAGLPREGTWKGGLSRKGRVQELISGHAHMSASPTLLPSS